MSLRRRSILSMLLMVVLVITALGAIACNNEGETVPEPETGGTLVIGNNADVDSLDPHLAADLYTVRVCDQIFDTLIRLDFSGDYVGSLAESWDVADEGRTWELTLRQDVYFHDGEPLTADDVVHSFRRIMDPEFDSPRRGDLAGVDGVEGITGDGDDPDRVNITLVEPNGAFLSTLLNIHIVPVPDADAREWVPVGSGPFKFGEWVPEERVALERFADYWGGASPLEGLVFRPIPEVSTRVVELETGGIHLMDEVPGEDMERLEDMEGIEIDSTVGSNYSVLGLNTTREPFDDPMVRQAIAHAIDRERLVEVVYPGTAVAADGPLPPSSWAYDEDFNGPAHDLERAANYMENSSVPDGFSAELLISEGERMQRGAILIQSMLEEIGIELEIVTQEWGTFLQSLMGREYDMLRVAWTTDPEPDALLYSLLHSGSEMLNFSGFASEEVDSLLDRARVESDVSERARMYREVQSIVVAEAPMIYLLHENHVAAYPEEVRDFRPHLTGAYYFQSSFGAATWMAGD